MNSISIAELRRILGTIDFEVTRAGRACNYENEIEVVGTADLMRGGYIILENGGGYIDLKNITTVPKEA